MLCISLHGKNDDDDHDNDEDVFEQALALNRLENLPRL